MSSIYQQIGFTVPNSTGMPFKKWASLVQQGTAGYVDLPTNPDEKTWQDWARALYGSTSFGQDLSDPRMYKDWRAWAAQWNNTGI